MVLFLLATPVRWMRRRLLSRRNFLIAVFVFCCFAGVFLLPKKAPQLEIGQSKAFNFRPGQPHRPLQCSSRSTSDFDYENAEYRRTARVASVSSAQSPKFKLKSRSKVLLLLQSSVHSPLANDLLSTFGAIRLAYRAELMKHSLPYLTRSDLGKYALVVFEDAASYFGMDEWNRQILHNYCRQFGVGILAFVSKLPHNSKSFDFTLSPTPPDFRKVKIKVEALKETPSKFAISNHSEALRIARPGSVWELEKDTESWNIFDVENKSNAFRTLASVALRNDKFNRESAVVLEDIGAIDGVHRVFFGHASLGPTTWMNRVLLLDALSLLLGTSVVPLERYLIVDIDDIFVGGSHKRLLEQDVHELIALQKRLRRVISPSFTLNLGYSGGYYLHGNEVEDAADRLLLDNANNFNWFHHNWLHRKPHLMTYDKMVEDIKQNVEFAQLHSIPLDTSYSIAPFHSGVYPIHEPLYSAWRHVLGVAATATEHYPHSRPSWRRRGFIHTPSGIQVMPRHSLGIYTHTNYFSDLPRGKRGLDADVAGGILFTTLLTTPVLALMTHQSNYALDRLAPYAIESLVAFAQCNTRLQLKWVPPSHAAAIHFAMFPEDATSPTLTNPCEDKNHLALWSPQKSCHHLPDLLILGPQKTGSTALAQFLSLHPNTIANRPTKRSYEETQFFSDSKTYGRGLDYYMSLFDIDSTSMNRSQWVVFEKSATYFDSEVSLSRIKSLLPRAKLVVLLEDPARRAYSWFQHQKARGNAVALNASSFYQVLTSSNAKGKSLRNRCLHPGQYAQTIDKWLAQFSARQLHIVDAERLRLDPISTMNELQKWLKLETQANFSSLLRFDKGKGFYCPVRHKCLGKSKGRKYEPMSNHERIWLSDYFRAHNLRLMALLRHLGYRIPEWLKREIVAPSNKPQSTTNSS